MQRLRSEFMWRCSQWGSAGRGARRPRTPRCGPGARTCARRAEYAETRAGDDLVRRPHPPGAARGGRGAGRAVGQRREGDAARGLPARAGRARAPAAGGRPRAARPDDPPLRQRRGVAGVQHRGDRRARPPGAARSYAALPRHPPVGPLDDRRRGPDALLPPHRPPRPEAPPPLRDAAARLDRARAAMGDRPRAAAAAGRSTSRAAGARAPAGPTTRWRCCAADGAASPWRS